MSAVLVHQCGSTVADQAGEFWCPSCGWVGVFEVWWLDVALLEEGS